MIREVILKFFLEKYSHILKQKKFACMLYKILETIFFIILYFWKKRFPIIVIELLSKKFVLLS